MLKLDKPIASVYTGCNAETYLEQLFRQTFFNTVTLFQGSGITVRLWGLSFFSKVFS